MASYESCQSPWVKALDPTQPPLDSVKHLCQVLLADHVLRIALGPSCARSRVLRLSARQKPVTMELIAMVLALTTEVGLASATSVLRYDDANQLAMHADYKDSN